MTGLVAGAGVWTTHFAAMLAYMPKLSIGFEPWATSGSLVIAVIGMTAAFSAPVLSPGRGVRPLAGFLAGLTIAAMHFTGISALRTEGVIQWNLGYVVASVAIGGTLASAAMTSFGRLRERAAWVTASLLMIVAIVGLHFTAMTALTLVYVPAEMPVAIVSRTALAFAVTGVMALILVAIAALVWMENFGRRSAFKGVHGALNSVSAGLAFFDSLGRLVSWNDAFASMIGSSAIVLKPGVSRQQLIDASHEAGWSAVGEEALSQHWQNRGRGAAMPASVVKLPDGRFLRQEFFSGGDGGGVTVMTDITAEETFGRMMTEARDAAEAASRAKSRFLANLSHEIRTPLNGILGLTDILAASDLPAGQLETVRIIQSSGGLLNALLSDLLDLAQAEAGVTELRPEPQNLPDLMRSVTDLHATSAATKGLRLEVVAEGVDRLVACDGMRLGQVLGNLVSNAVKFSEAGGATVSARRDGDRVTFAVTDTGVGIDAAFHERL
ncbi:MAG TPA: MHYT domain-containing protein, partial [Phenylobacterium sp.]|nr:MHYT domain-containing protein [Phenylobacterium sp.]